MPRNTDIEGPRHNDRGDHTGRRHDMLSEKSRPIIEATLPIIAERINDITPDFYRRMFVALPRPDGRHVLPLLPA